jgi:hypothetical protein
VRNVSSIPTDAEPAPQLLESVPAVLAVPVGWPERSWSLRCLFRGPLERTRRRALRPPGRRDRLAPQRFAGDGTKPLVEMGGEQGRADVPQAVVMA